MANGDKQEASSKDPFDGNPEFSLKADGSVPDLPPDTTFTPSEQLEAWTRNVDTTQGDKELDVAAFVKAQSAFIKAQTAFMTSGLPPSVDDAYRNVSRYSRAQGDFIAAQNAVLAQLGVV